MKRMEGIRGPRSDVRDQKSEFGNQKRAGVLIMRSSSHAVVEIRHVTLISMDRGRRRKIADIAEKLGVGFTLGVVAEGIFWRNLL
jgi:dissimilatory sulfite reductase (desulfoviridin) alpha/beta subunit